MRLLGRYVFREIAPSALLGVVLATFIIFLHGIGPIFELLVGSGNSDWKTAVVLLGLAMPPLLPYTIPFGVLVGILIGLGRMASDGEVIAMRAAGVSTRKVIAPVMAFAILGACVAGAMSLRYAPRSIRESTAITNDLLANQLSAEIQPRVFDENFPNTILYVGEVQRYLEPAGQGPIALWKPVFIADLTPPEQRPSGLGAQAEGPLITVAREALAVSDPQHNRIQLTLRDYSTYEMGKDRVAHDIWSEHGQQALDAEPPRQKTLAPSAMNTRALVAAAKAPDAIDARIELHRRFALPVACLMLALVGIPLGIVTRKGGKSAGYVTAVLL
ncbi:MAG TPA: LptF/LptG family permease, partial [Bryobacteraceae bacterium]